MVYYTKFTDYWLPLIGTEERLQSYMSYMCIDYCIRITKRVQQGCSDVSK